MTIEFVIPGDPVPKGRPRVTRTGHAYTPQKTRLYEAHIQDLWRRKGLATLPKGLPIAVSVDAYFAVPKSVSKKRRNTMDGAPHVYRPDADNVAKAVLDALNQLAFDDDSNIYLLRVSKRYTLLEPRVEVTIEWEETNGTSKNGLDEN